MSAGRFGRCLARLGVELDQGAVRWSAIRAVRDPARNLYEWPLVLLDAGPEPGVVAGAVEPTAPGTAVFLPTMMPASAARPA